MNSGIYEIRNLINGKRYIGSATNFKKRARDHMGALQKGAHDNSRLQNAWNKYGSEAFTFTPLLVCRKGDLLLYEQRCIDGFLPEYNIALTAGSMLGFKHSEISKRQMSATKRGRPLSLSAERRIQLSELMLGNKYHLGKKASPETRARLSAARIGNTNGRGGKGLKRSSETRARIAAAKMGTIHSLETKRKCAKAKLGNKIWLGRKHTLETRAKISATKRAHRVLPIKDLFDG